MRSLALVALCACTAVDPMVGTYGVTVTGMDNQTAPTMQTTTVSGAGTVAVTGGKTGPQSYLVTFGQEGYLCSLKATKSTVTALQLDVPDMQSCRFGNFTAVTTDGRLTLDKESMTLATLTLSYTYSGQVVFNFSGTGTRTYTGPRQ